MENNMQWVAEAVEKIKEKMAWVSVKSQEKIPAGTLPDGTHDDWSADDKIDWWTNGFWGGLLWLLYAKTKDESYAKIAAFSEKKLDRGLEMFENLHHDVGFMWMPTSVSSYRLTGDMESKRRALHAAAILAGRFNPAGQFIRAWNTWPDSENTGWAIIDCMMNLPLLYWAAKELNDPRFRHIAMCHADMAMKHFVRPDGSVKHIICFDPETGEYINNRTGQGYDENSSWTRGQAWGLYGFTLSYMYTGKKEYLDTAKRIAHYFMANIPESGLIPVDFRQPREPNWEDSSAAAIAACGLLEIVEHVPDLEKDMYKNAAVRLLKTLYDKRCNWTKDNDCIVEKCTGLYHTENHEFNLIYGDFYFVEGVFRLTGDWYMTM